MTEGQSLRETRPLVQISKLPIVRNIIESFDRSAEKIGLHEASVNFLDRLKCKVNIFYGQEDIANILKEKPTIVVATHNKNQNEGLPLLASLPPRDDLYIFGSAGYLKWGESFKKHLLPLYISNKSTKGLVGWFHTKTEFEAPNVGSKKVLDRNLASLDDGARKLEEGHQVIIFPEGNRHNEKPRPGIWHLGIGYLIDKLSKPSDTYITMVKIGDPHLQISKDSLFGVDINFLKPISVEDFQSQFELNKKNPKTITRALEKKYYGFR
jgi:1-acyl-sn-glycerol-3-phosphate acyltransferase